LSDLSSPMVVVGGYPSLMAGDPYPTYYHSCPDLPYLTPGIKCP
jgi:hypothetical protein